MSPKLYHLLACVDELLRQWFQPTCLVCSALSDRNALCSHCLHFKKLSKPLCRHCGEPTAFSIDKCGMCTNYNSNLDAIRSDFWLTEASRMLIHYIKYNGRYELLGLIEQSICFKFEPCLPPNTEVIAVPIHLNKRLERGFNQSDLIAQWIVRKNGGFNLCLGLEKFEDTLPQSVLGKGAREKNLAHSFRWTEGVSVPQTVLLVDDIYTTGRTLETCAKVLKKAGVKSVYGWTLFRTPRIMGE